MKKLSLILLACSPCFSSEYTQAIYLNPSALPVAASPDGAMYEYIQVSIQKNEGTKKQNSGRAKRPATQNFPPLEKINAAPLESPVGSTKKNRP